VTLVTTKRPEMTRNFARAEPAGLMLCAKSAPQRRWKRSHFSRLGSVNRDHDDGEHLTSPLFVAACLTTITMSSANQLLLFVIVGQNEPLYEAEFLKNASNTASDSATRQNYFVLHSALDLVEKAAWTTNNMYLKVVDKVRL